MSTLQQFSKQDNYEDIFQEGQNNKPKYSFKPPSRVSDNFYQQSKFSSAFFKDHIEEEYAIYRAFTSNNFTYLRNLPDNFKHGQLLNQRKQKVSKTIQQQSTLNINSQIQTKNKKQNAKRKQQIGTLGYFSKFQYDQNNYNMPKILQNITRLQNQQKRQKISNIDFRPSGIQTKLKYEDPFKYVQKINNTEVNNNNNGKTITTADNKDNNNNSKNNTVSGYVFPFHIPQDTYNSFHQSQKRKKIISDSLKINGDFLPAQSQKVLSKITKQQLNLILNDIEFLLKKYLKNIGFFIGVTANDHIQLLFQSKLSDQRKISLLMSKICEHEQISKYLLRRNLNKWGILDKEKGFYVYAMLPSWIKNEVEKLQK